MVASCTGTAGSGRIGPTRRMDGVMRRGNSKAKSVCIITSGTCCRVEGGGGKSKTHAQVHECTSTETEGEREEVRRI